MQEVDMKGRSLVVVLSIITALFLFSEGGEAAGKAKYVGYKKCGGCHKSQRDSWKETTHAKAFDALKPGEAAEAKKKAGLDPNKDYTKDEECLPCHVTGYKEKGGYKIGISKTKAKYLVGVTCEMCHGAGDRYRRLHRDAGNKFKKSGKTTPRANLEKMGQYVSTEAIKKACYSCHMNYEGSGWDGVKKPYTPFTPDVDPKYKFDFDKAVKDTKALHKHFKMKGVFTGEPKFKYHDEFQQQAAEGKE